MTNSAPTPPQTRRNRKVSALTAQQAQHKRDLDRRAQRASRQRVKSRLQDLEDDLARAKTDCSVRERQLMDEVHLLREENRKLRSYLDSIGQFALNGAAETDNKTDTGIDDTASPDPDRATTETEGEPILGKIPALPSSSLLTETLWLTTLFPPENDDQRGAAYDEPQRGQALVEDTDGVLIQSMRDIDSNEYTRAQSGQGMATSAYPASANMSMGHPGLPSPETESSLSRHPMRQFAESRGKETNHSMKNDTGSDGLYRRTHATGIPGSATTNPGLTSQHFKANLAIAIKPDDIPTTTHHGDCSCIAKAYICDVSIGPDTARFHRLPAVHGGQGIRCGFRPRTDSAIFTSNSTSWAPNSGGSRGESGVG